MDRETINRLFPDEAACIAFLEEARWGTGRAQCPHCAARKASPMPTEARYHCNGCGVSFSVTTRSFMHRARVERRQWVAAVIAATERQRVSARALAERVGVNRNTAAHMLTRIRLAQVEETEFFGRILQNLLARMNDGN
ncbi:MAG TPA: transposase [Armatimonadota bacterium]|nr:transposase [Armatimonadota bacterium]